MEYNKNEPAYYLPFVEYKGKEYLIYQENAMQYKLVNEVRVSYRNRVGINVFTVPTKHCTLFVKIVVPKFKIGDKVKKKFDHAIAFHVTEYTIFASCGMVWYRDEWSKKTGLEAGALEEDLELCNY